MRRSLIVVGLLCCAAPASAANPQGGESPYLGVELLSITPELRLHYGAEEKRGVLLSRLDAEGPAARAGLQVGDVLLSIDARDIVKFSQAIYLLAAKRPGDRVTIDYVRDKEAKTVEVTLGARKQHRVQIGPFRWRGPTPLIDPGALNESMRRLREELKGVDGRRVIRFQRERRGLEDRLRMLEGKLEELERRLGEDA
ncbi:MAG: PDZ domain-containing protein [Myxococcota bacterium]